jgi:6-phosphogluconolactonase (cycloisomerase 2 family)
MNQSRRTISALAVILFVGLPLVGCAPADDGNTATMEGATSETSGAALAMPEDASGSGVPEGVAQFRVDPFWPQPLPNNWILGQVAGTAVDSNDNVWIIHRPWTVQGTNAGSTPMQTTRDNTWGHDPLQSLCCTTAPPVVAFDPQGNVIQAWGGNSPNGEYEWFNSEHGIYVDHNGFVWVAGNGDGDHHMMKFTQEGEFVMQIGGVGVSGGSNDTESVNRAAAMTVDPETNELYVADGYGNRRLVVFDAETGEYRRHWGAYGEAPVDENPGPWDPNAPPSRTWRTPVHGVVISNDGLVYVTDRPSNRIQVFQKDGTYVTESVLAPETYGPGSTWGVELDPLDEEQRFLYVPDGTNNKVWALDRETLEPVYSWGRGGRQPGQFDWLHYMDFDSQGNLYTGEVQTGHRVQKFIRVNGG